MPPRGVQYWRLYGLEDLRVDYLGASTTTCPADRTFQPDTCRHGTTAQTVSPGLFEMYRVLPSGLMPAVHLIQDMGTAPVLRSEPATELPAARVGPLALSVKTVALRSTPAGSCFR